MKTRLLTGWNLQRLGFLIAGLLTILASMEDNGWLGILMGSYFSAMGLFALGCAAGSCNNVGHHTVNADKNEKK
ncbi:MAG: hypothetical protein RLZZ165_2285 [Bacteroidota bacterium]|jgi:hypothetical protein